MWRNNDYDAPPPYVGGYGLSSFHAEYEVFALPVRSHDRQGENEDRAASRFSPDNNFAVVIFNDAFADGKTQSGAAGFAVRGKRLE